MKKNDNEEMFFLVRSGNEVLFNQMINSLNVNVVNDLGQTLLHEAIACKNKHFVKTLIKLGVDTSARDKKGKTALHYAAVHQDIDAVKLLLDKSDVNAVDNNINTPLFDALMSSRKDYDLVELLIKNDVNPFIKNKAGRSVSQIILETNNDRLISLINGLKNESL